MIATAQPSIGTGSARRRTASTATTIAPSNSSTAFASATSTSVRPKPNVWRSVGGRAAMRSAAYARARATTSEIMCTASASTASEPSAKPPTTSTTRKAALATSAMTSARLRVSMRGIIASADARRALDPPHPCELASIRCAMRTRLTQVRREIRSLAASGAPTVGACSSRRPTARAIAGYRNGARSTATGSTQSSTRRSRVMSGSPSTASRG